MLNVICNEALNQIAGGSSAGQFFSSADSTNHKFYAKTVPGLSIIGVKITEIDVDVVSTTEKQIGLFTDTITTNNYVFPNYIIEEIYA